MVTLHRWKFADLVRHTGTVHRWARDLVAHLARRYQRMASPSDWPADGPPAAQAQWFAAGGRDLLSVLRAADPDTKMWAWGANHQVRFWSRRMTHETGIHRADAELTMGRTPTFEPAVADDGIGEFLENLRGARSWRWNIGKLRGAGEIIELVPSDVPGAWTVTLTDGPFTWRHHARGPRAQVTVTGTANDLYLLCWRRYRYTDSRFRITGDQDLFDLWYRNSAV